MTSGNLAGLKKKLAQLERKYERAEGKPVVQARIMKTAAAIQKQIDRLEGDN